MAKKNYYYLRATNYDGWDMTVIVVATSRDDAIRHWFEHWHAEDLADEIDYYKEKNEDPTEDYPEGLIAHFVDRASWDSRNIPGGLWILTFPAPDDAPEGPIGWDYSDEFVGDSGRAAVQAIVEANLELDVA